KCATETPLYEPGYGTCISPDQPLLVARDAGAALRALTLESNMRLNNTMVLSVGMVASMVLVPQASAGTFTLYSMGENVVVNTGPPSDPFVLKVTSDTSAGHPGYGGMYYTDTNNPLFTFNSLTNLSALYQMTQGTFGGGGAPRFTLFDDQNRTAFVY